MQAKSQIIPSGKPSLELIQVIIILLLSLLIPAAKGQNANPVLRLAVASNFLATARLIANDFENDTGIKITLSSGSSGKLTTQIKFGAPYDIFLSADLDAPRLLIEERLAYPESLRTYAIGQLVLISRIELDKDQHRINRSAAQIAIANPKIAPYGRAALNWLEEQSGWPRSSYQLLIGENINQAWHFYSQGGADIALVALSQVRLANHSYRGNVKLLTLPKEQLQQGLVILNSSPNIQAAKQFTQFIGSEAAKRHLISAGYLLPESIDTKIIHDKP